MKYIHVKFSFPYVVMTLLLLCFIQFSYANECLDSKKQMLNSKQNVPKEQCSASAITEVTLRDGQVFLKDGKEWYPKGMTFFGRVIPKGHKSNASTIYAQKNFGQKYIDALKWWGGDTVRLQIGMPFLDPQSDYFNPEYIEQVSRAVDLARRNGMAVILSMQWQKRINVPDAEKYMPGASALRAWEYTAPKFSTDKGVIYELFNEPVTSQNPSHKEWIAWQNGHQQIVDMIRKKRIENTLIVEGPTMGKILSEKYLIEDPLNQTAYGIHPRLRAYLNTPEEWDERFGSFANSHAVIATEWGHGGKTCKTADVKVAKEFLQYLDKKNIGLIGWGMETKKSNQLRMLKTGKYYLAGFSETNCDSNNSGPGKEMEKLFKKHKGGN